MSAIEDPKLRNSAPPNVDPTGVQWSGHALGKFMVDFINCILFQFWSSLKEMIQDVQRKGK